MVEQKEVINGVQIKYKYKQRKYDTQHIIFVFCGFGSASMFTYDFENALQDCPAHVVWIKDDFNDCCAYYLCQNMNYSIEQAVITFIESMLARYGLDRSCCTLAGFSKGGTAALYYGLKYHFINIVSTVPQFHIGTFAKREWPLVFKHMADPENENSIFVLDTLLPQLLRDNGSIEKNIYLLTSEADYQYEKEIKPYLDGFRKYRNFNLLMATSQLIREHNQVTSYHVPLLLGIFYSLSQGAVPHYGYCELIADNTLVSRPVKPQPVAILKKIAVMDTLIFPEGIAVLKGVSCGEYQDIEIDLVFKNEGLEEVFRIAKAHRSILTRQLYEEGFVNYDKGWFCTAKFQGLNIHELPAGRYRILLDITCQEHYARKALEVDAGADNKMLASSKSVDVYSQNGHVYLWKKS
jgi:hypothetical protein